MQIELIRLLEQTGVKKEIETPFTDTEITVRGEVLPVAKAEPVKITLVHKGRGRIAMEASCEVELTMSCARCLREVPYRFELTPAEEWTVAAPGSYGERELARQAEEALRAHSGKELNAAEVEDTLGVGEAYLVNNVLDTDALIRNELYLNMPLRVLCKEDCKGLCMHCGADLNEGDCGCDTFVPDPRMAAILDLFKESESKK